MDSGNERPPGTQAPGHEQLRNRDHDAPGASDLSGSSSMPGGAGPPATHSMQGAGSAPDVVCPMPQHSIPAAPADGDIARLRSLLFQREIALIDELRSRLESPAEHARDVSSVIAEALVIRAGKDERLSMALQPIVENIFKASLRKNPKEFTNLLFPLMGPSLRKSIAEAFRSMLGNFNKSIEMSFSWKGLHWRLEALRTGRPFSEVVLLHTLIYRVEELYFIHSGTGIDLAHVANEGVDSHDASMISAMLTAIQDFVRDCFVSGNEGDLESLRHGEYTVLVEKHELAYIACVLRGTPPADFQSQVRDCLELLLVEYADELEYFEGDTGPFMPAERHLEQLLSARFVDDDKPLPLWVRALPIVLALALTGGYGYWKYEQIKDEEQRAAVYQSRERMVEALRNEPGVLLVNAEARADGTWQIFCLKDELARSPESVLEQLGAEPGDFSFTVVPYVSYHQAIVSERVLEKVNPPESVSVRFEEGTLYFSGTAPLHWILQAHQEALALPGVTRVDMTKLSDPRTERISALVKEVEGTVVQFPLNKDTPVPEDRENLVKAMDALVDLEKLAREMGIVVSLTIYGHADSTGQDKRNYEISQARAGTIAAMLYARGSSMPMSIYGMGADYAKEGDRGKPDQASRRIELKVHLAQAGTAPLETLIGD